MKTADFVIAFDIRDEKRLRKLSKEIERLAFRIQLSVFYIRCDRKKLEEIVELVHKYIEMEEDDVRIYRVDLKKSLFLRKSEDVRVMII